MVMSMCVWKKENRFRKKLKEGRTKSCGCRQHFHKFNDMREEDGTLFIKVGNREVLIDKEDLDKIYPNRVFISESGYAKCRSHQRIHRLFIECPEGLEIDHINRNRLDNRKSNLRAVTRSENLKNREVKKMSTNVQSKRRSNGKGRGEMQGVQVLFTSDRNV